MNVRRRAVDEATRDRTTTPATDAALERRERLLQAILDVTAALRADPEPPDVWRSGVRQAAALLAATIQDHVQEAEAEDGLLNQVARDAPQLTARVQALRAEHPALEADARTMLETWPEDDAPPQTLRVHVEPVVQAARRHREHGTALLMDTYALDLSAGD